MLPIGILDFLELMQDIWDEKFNRVRVIMFPVRIHIRYSNRIYQRQLTTSVGRGEEK